MNMAADDMSIELASEQPHTTATQPLSVSCARQHRSNDEEDEFGDDEMLRQLLGGGEAAKMKADPLPSKEADEKWNNLDSVHSRASVYDQPYGKDEEDSLDGSTGSFGDDDSETDLNASTVCELRDTSAAFKRLDDAPKRRMLMTRSSSLRFQRASSFRGSLDLIKESSLH